MSIKDFFEKIGFKFGKPKVEQIAAEGLEVVQAAIKEVEGKDAQAVATEGLLGIARENPSAIFKILEAVQKEYPEVVIEAVKQLPKEDEFSGATVVKAAEHLGLGEEAKIEIIQEGNMSFKHEMQLVETLEDEDTIEEIKKQREEKEEQRSLRKLESLYEECNEDMHEGELEEKLKRVMNDIYITTDRIEQAKNRIIARLIAFNYAQYGTTIVSKLRTIISAQEMYDASIVELAKQEYEKIINEYKEIKGKPVKEFKEEELRFKIESEMKATAKKSKYNEIEAVRNLQRKIQSMSDEDKEYWLKNIQNILGNPNIAKTMKNVLEAETLEKLSKLPDIEQRKVLETTNGVLEKHNVKNNISKATPKVKSYRFNGELKKDGEER